MFDEIKVFNVVHPTHACGENLELPGGVVKEIHKQGESLSAKHKILRCTSEALGQYSAYLLIGFLLASGQTIYRIFQLVVGHFKPLKKLQNVVFIRELLASWLHVETHEVELKDALLWQLPKQRMHRNLVVINSCISEATLVSVLTSINPFFGSNFIIDSFVDNNQLFCNISLNGVAQI